MNPKVKAALLAGVLFFIISSPITYDFIDRLLNGMLGRIANNGCPTTWGLILHSCAFAVANYYDLGV